MILTIALAAAALTTLALILRTQRRDGERLVALRVAMKR